MQPGETTDMHSHPALVGYAIRGGRFRFTSPNGESMEMDITAGQPMFMDAVTHTTENVGDTEAHVLLVELK